METLIQKITDELTGYQKTIESNPNMKLAGNIVDEIYKLSASAYYLSQLPAPAAPTTPAA